MDFEDHIESIAFYHIACFSGSFNAAPPPHPPRLLKNKSTKTLSAWGGEVADLSKEKGPEPFPPWAFIRFIHTGIQIKLVNHC